MKWPQGKEKEKGEKNDEEQKLLIGQVRKGR